MTMRNHSRGFALPVALFALVVVGILVTGGFYMANQETRISHSGERATEAFYNAERGIAHVLGRAWSPTYADLDRWEETVVTPSDPDAEGHWTARITGLDHGLLLVSSEGTAAVNPDNGAALRKISQVVRIPALEMDVPGALMTRGGARITGSARIDGHDQNPPDWDDPPGEMDDFCPTEHPDRPGVVHDEGSEVQTDGGGEVEGDPPTMEDPDMTEEDFTQFGDLSWEDLTAMADYSLPPGTINNTEPQLAQDEDTDDWYCDRSDPYNWGDPRFEEPDPDDPDRYPCANHFPIIHIDGDASIQSAGVGQGILLVDGDLDLQGDFTFHGIVVAQGSFETAGGGPRVMGGVMAANADLENQDYVGSSVVQTSGCAQHRARSMAQANRPMALEGRSWADITSSEY